MRVLMDSKLCELELAPELLVITLCKSSVYPITNPNAVSSHTHTRDSTILAIRIRYNFNFWWMDVNKVVDVASYPQTSLSVCAPSYTPSAA
jgi:hypothetical protein